MVFSGFKSEGRRQERSCRGRNLSYGVSTKCATPCFACITHPTQFRFLVFTHKRKFALHQPGCDNVANGVCQPWNVSPFRSFHCPFDCARKHSILLYGQTFFSPCQIRCVLCFYSEGRNLFSCLYRRRPKDRSSFELRCLETFRKQ